jgi:glycopeptide antibiotics resistance protein
MKTGNAWFHFIVRALFAAYMCALFKIILLKLGPADVEYMWERMKYNLIHPEYIAARIHAGNLVPLKEISRALEVMSGPSQWNLLGNVTIFIPFGVFLGALAKAGRPALAGVFWRSLGVSLGLEIAQVLFSIGTFDVDDLILNSVGGSIGYIVYTSWTALLRREKSDTLESTSFLGASHEADHGFNRGR